jgi:hypothetical protein
MTALYQKCEPALSTNAASNKEILNDCDKMPQRLPQIKFQIYGVNLIKNLANLGR